MTKHSNPEQIMELLLEFIPHLTVTNHIPGQIILKFSLSGLGTFANRDISSIENIPGIIETRTRLFSRSIVIAYDSDQLPFELWESLMRLKEEPDQAVVVQDLLKEFF